jgi:iron complex outermembrane recepter protein
VTGTPRIRITPVDSDSYVLTPFVQDEIAISRSFTLSAGVKGGHENIPGIELQPSVRALWMLSPRQSVWGSLTRVVRTPNRFERGMHIISAASPGQGPLPFVVTLEGSPDRTFESVVAVETGYRAQGHNASLDVTGYAGEYFNLAQMQRGTPAPAMEIGTPVIRLPLTSVGNGHADARGVETAVTWKPVGPWQIAGNYSAARVQFVDSRGASASAVPVNGPTPAQQFHARTFVDVTPRLQVGALFYRTSSIPKIDIRAFNTLDAQATWSLSDRVKVTGGAKGLLHGDGIEYRDTLTNVVPAPVRPNPYIGMTWGF